MKKALIITLSFLAIMKLHSMGASSLALSLQQNTHDGVVLQTVCFVMSKKTKLANNELELIDDYDSKPRKFSDSEKNDVASTASTIDQDWQELQNDGLIFDSRGSLEVSYKQVALERLNLDEKIDRKQ